MSARYFAVSAILLLAIYIQSSTTLELSTGSVKEYIVGVYPSIFASNAALTEDAKKNVAKATFGFTATGTIELSHETIFKTLLGEDDVLRLNNDLKIAFVIENFKMTIPTPIQEDFMPTKMSLSASETTTSLPDEDMCNETQTFPDPYFWGQQRISQRERVAYDSGNYTYSYSGEDSGTNVFAYVIDSGIATNHTEFGGRAVWGFTADEHANESNWDLNGHGTHVAGILGGDNIGVAKDVMLVAVKVLGEDGSGSFFGVISGISFAKEHYLAMRKKSPSVRGVINLSLGAYAGIYRVMERAIQDVTDAGLIVVAAAGNDNLDACGHTPSNAPAAISVGASTVNDTRASFSNYGSCVHIMAPGLRIKSSTINTTNLANIYRVFSGTSMASPFVAGVVARYLSITDGNRTTVLQFMQSQATRHALDLNGTNTQPDTPNLLLYAGCYTGFTGILHVPSTAPPTSVQPTSSAPVLSSISALLIMIAASFVM